MVSYNLVYSTWYDSNFSLFNPKIKVGIAFDCTGGMELDGIRRLFPSVPLTNAWSHVYLPRTLGLVERSGIHALDVLVVLAFGTWY